STRTGPEDLLELVEDGELPEVEPGRIRTVDTEEGPVRMLVTGIVAGGDTVGRATIAGSLEDVEEDARDALAGVAVASAIGLVLGGVALTVATRRAIRPATELARAVSST